MLHLSRDRTKRDSAKTGSRTGFLAALLGYGLGLMLLGGCDVTVRGEKRPLVRHEGIRGAVETVVEHRTDKQESGVTKRESESIVFEEWLKLRTNGDVYHPDFVNYSAAVGAGLSQQYLDTEGISEWSTDTLSEYLVSAEILRAKPYSGTLNASKSEDLIARQFLGPLRADRESESASAFLRSESWPMMFQYSTSETSQEGFTPLEADFFTREDERFRYSVDHDFSESSHAHFDYDTSDARQESVGAVVDTLMDTYTLSHDHLFGPNDVHRLDSLINYVDQTGTFEFESFRWQERLRLQHTPSLLSRYDVQYTDLERETLNSEQIRGQAGIEHRLFESLVTNLDGFVSQTDLDEQGELSQYGGIFGLNYRKTNPLGTLFSSYTANFTRSDQSGGAGMGTVIGEAHTATDIIPVELDRTGIDISTIRVRTAGGVLYQQGDDYTITQMDGRTFLNIITVGGAIPPNFTGGEQFFVDYEFFIEPQRREDTFRQSFTIRQRFDNGFSVFYTYRTQDESIDSTVAEVVPDEYTIHTVAADYTRGGLFLLAEHSDEDSTLIPLTSTRLEGRYRWTLEPATSFGVGLTNQWLDFDEPDAREVTLLEGTAEIFSRLTDNWSLEASLDYRDEEDSRFGLTKGFQFDTEVQYEYRQFRARIGAELNFLERRADRIDSIFLYLQVQRRF